MKENKIYRLFQSLKPNDVKQLRKEMDSPHYSVKPILKSLFRILSRQYPHFDCTESGKKKLFAKLHPNRPYNDLKLRRYFSNLTKIIIDYLNFETLYRDTWLREKNLAEIYEKAQLYSLAHEKRQQLHAFIDQHSIKKDEYWKKKCTLYQMEYASLSTEKENTPNQILKNLLHASDHYFAYTTLRQALLTKSKSLVFNTAFSMPFLNAVKEQSQKNSLKECSLFQLYLLGLKMLEHDCPDNFFAYESAFFQKKEKLHGEDSLLFFYLGLNYVVRQTNKGNESFRKTALIWYKFALREGILLYQKTLSKETFNNIVLYGCEAGEEDWTLKFITEYSAYLPKDIQKDELIYSSAIVFFYQKKYPAVIDNIKEYSFSQGYIMKTRMLLLRSYFEEFTSDFSYAQLLMSNINSYENYLNKNEDWPNKVKKPYLNFCRVLKKMVKLYLKKTEQKKIETWLLTEIEKNPKIAGKGWLVKTI